MFDGMSFLEIRKSLPETNTTQANAGLIGDQRNPLVLRALCKNKQLNINFLRTACIITAMSVFNFSIKLRGFGNIFN